MTAYNSNRLLIDDVPNQIMLIINQCSRSPDPIVVALWEKVGEFPNTTVKFVQRGEPWILTNFVLNQDLDRKAKILMNAKFYPGYALTANV